jgi:hypothetical protein
LKTRTTPVICWSATLVDRARADSSPASTRRAVSWREWIGRRAARTSKTFTRVAAASTATARIAVATPSPVGESLGIRSPPPTTPRPSRARLASTILWNRGTSKRPDRMRPGRPSASGVMKRSDRVSVTSDSAALRRSTPLPTSRGCTPLSAPGSEGVAHEAPTHNIAPG